MEEISMKFGQAHSTLDGPEILEVLVLKKPGFGYPWAVSKLNYPRLQDTSISRTEGSCLHRSRGSSQNSPKVLFQPFSGTPKGPNGGELQQEGGISENYPTLTSY